MGFKPFKWIKKHPLETAAIVALAGTGLGAAGIGPMAGLFAGEGAAAGAAGAGAAGWVPAEGGAAYLGGMAADSALLSPIAGTMASNVAGGIANLVGPSNFTAAMAGDAFMPAALGAEGTGTPSWGSLLGSKFASGGGMNARDAMLLGQMTGMGQQPQQQPHLGGPVDMSNPYQRPAMATQDAITKKWLLQNDPATYARLYGQVPQGVV